MFKSPLLKNLQIVYKNSDYLHTVSAPSTRYGNAIAASFLTSVVLAFLSLQNQAVVSTLGSPKQPSTGTHIYAGRIAKEISGVMVNGSDGLGQAASVIARFSESS